MKRVLGIAFCAALAACKGESLPRPPSTSGSAGKSAAGATAAAMMMNQAGQGPAGAGAPAPQPTAAGAKAAGAGSAAQAGLSSAGQPAPAVTHAGAPNAGAPSAGGAAAGGTGGAAGLAAASGGAGAAAAGSGTAGAGGKPALACAGKPGKQRGKLMASVMAGGQRRTFIHYASEKLDADTPVPQIIVPHGCTQSREEMFRITKYPQLADREGFVALSPEGAQNSTGPWDVGSGVCGNGVFVPGRGDDQAFVDAMIEYAAADQCIDREHIFMSGWSMGGYLSHHSGCLRDDIRAIGLHSAGTHDLGRCQGKPKPVIMHFNPDGLIDYSCGVRARDGWLKRNGCSASHQGQGRKQRVLQRLRCGRTGGVLYLRHSAQPHRGFPRGARVVRRQRARLFDRGDRKRGRARLELFQEVLSVFGRAGRLGHIQRFYGKSKVPERPPGASTRPAPANLIDLHRHH